MQSKTYVEDVSGSSVEWWSKWNVCLRCPLMQVKRIRRTKDCSSFLVRSREDKSDIMPMVGAV